MKKQGKSSEILAISLLALSSFFLFADQNLLAPNLTQVAREFGFNDLERDMKLGGDISLVFWLLGGTVSLGIGWLTDRFPRKYLYVAVLLAMMRTFPRDERRLSELLGAQTHGHLDKPPIPLTPRAMEST